MGDHYALNSPKSCSRGSPFPHHRLILSPESWVHQETFLAMSSLGEVVEAFRAREGEKDILKAKWYIMAVSQLSFDG